MPTPKHELLIALRYLRNAAPSQYNDMVQAFAAHSHTITVAVTEAKADEIFVAQGRAQQCRSLLRMMLECHIERPTPQ